MFNLRLAPHQRAWDVSPSYELWKSQAIPFRASREYLVDSNLFCDIANDHCWPSIQTKGWRETLRHKVLNADLTAFSVLEMHKKIELMLILMDLADALIPLEKALESLEYVTRDRPSYEVS